MAEVLVIKISEIRPEAECLTETEGAVVYDIIYPLLLSGRGVTLDFKETNIITASFFNVAIGQLLGGINPSELNSQLEIVNLPLTSCETLAIVIRNAKQYYTKKGWDVTND